MFRDPLKLRRIGRLLSVFAIIGMLFSLIGIGGIWVLRPGITQNLSNLVGLAHETLSTSQSAIGFLSGSVSQVDEDLILIQSSLDGLESSLNTIADSLVTSSSLVGDDLNLTLTEVQTAVTSAAASAEFIDDTLAFIAAIPLLGADYQPETPLHISLSKVAEDMNEIPASLTSLETSLDSAAIDFQSVSEDLADLSEDLTIIMEDLDGAQDILTDYEGIISTALQKVERFESRLNLYTIITSLLLTGVLLWLGIAQFGVYLQAQDYIHFEQKIISLSDLDRE
ncbi:MAG: hypothetical protein H0S79_18200 [Anaerolineaceae bacterium]|nr:hypothetical protein [Anaerolineaceae bacterium]